MNQQILFPVTSLQKQVLLFIVHFFNRYHYSPTYYEVSLMIQDKDPAAVRHVVNALVTKGYLDKDPAKHRGLTPSKLLSEMKLRQIKRLAIA